MSFPPSLRLAIGFLTRLPVAHVDAPESSFGRALAWFPLVGAGLGAVLLGAERLLSGVLPTNLLAVALVALWAGMTGGLHLDGLADVVDGLGGGRGDRERTLAIMRDSRIGAHGATALTLHLLAKVSAVAHLTSNGGAALVLACPALARWAVVGLVLRYPYAREQGLGSLFHREARLRDGALGALAVVGTLACSAPRSLLPALAALLLVAAFGAFANARLRGLTGDVYGAAIELGELAFLVACCAHFA